MEDAFARLPSRRHIAVGRLRIALTYLWRHGHLPDVDNPQTFTEHVQYRKLYDRDHRMVQTADKVAVKDMVADRLGSEWIIPTYWHGDALPVAPIWPMPFMVKARHGCNQYAVVWDENADWGAIRRMAHRWTARHYGYWLDEWVYSRIPRGIIVEPFVGDGRSLPVDYKFYVFGGRVQFIQVHLDRGGRHRWIVFDRLWRRVSSPTADADPAPPQTLQRMIEAAEALATGFDFVRVDLYEISGRPLFGEMTFYPGSGLDRFDPVSLDLVIGQYWSAAKAGAQN